MTETVFIKDVIKGLKREYPTTLKIGYRTASTANVETGVQTETTSSVTVSKAIRLPSANALSYLQSLGASIKGMELYATSVQILIDLDDIPSGYNLKAPESYAEFGGKKYHVEHSEVYDYAAILFCRTVN